MAAALRNEPGVQVDVTDGSRGEFTVLVDGREVVRKDGDALPAENEVVAAVRNAGAHAAARP